MINWSIHHHHTDTPLRSMYGMWLYLYLCFFIYLVHRSHSFISNDHIYTTDTNTYILWKWKTHTHRHIIGQFEKTASKSIGTSIKSSEKFLDHFWPGQPHNGKYIIHSSYRNNSFSHFFYYWLTFIHMSYKLMFSSLHVIT